MEKYSKRKWELHPKYTGLTIKKSISKAILLKRLFVSLLLVSVLLVGCSPKTEVSLLPEDSIYFRGQNDGDITQTVLSIYYGTIHNAPMMNQIAIDYEVETGVRIDWTAADSGGLMLRGKFAINDAPDLFQLTITDVPTWVDFLADLSEEPWVEDVYDFSLQTVTVENKVYSWPHTLEGSGIVYNIDLFEQAGIDTVPRTLEELKEVTYRLDQAGIQPFGEAWMEFGYLAHLLSVPFNYEEDIKASSNAILFGTGSFGDLRYIQEFFDLFQLTIDYGWGQKSLGYNTLDQYPDFADGKMAMMKQGTWVERSVLALNENLNIGIFPVPLSENAEENKLQVATTTGISVNRESENLEEALLFLNWWHEHAQKYLIEIDRVLPPFKSVDTTGLGVLNHNMEHYILEGNAFEGFGWEYWPQGAMVQLAAPLQSYAAGLLTREEAIQELDSLYRTLR